MSFISCWLVGVSSRRLHYNILRRNISGARKYCIANGRKNVQETFYLYRRKRIFYRNAPLTLSCCRFLSTSSNEHRLPTKLENLCQELYQCPDKSSKLWKLVDWGNRLTETLTAEERTERHKIKGCLAAVYIKVIVRDEKVFLTGFADSKIAKGLVYFLVCGLQGTGVDLVRKLAAETIMEKSGLESILSSSRMVGIRSMLRYIQQQCNNTSHDAEQSSFSGLGYLSSDWHKEKIAVLLSGGVDSSVALSILLEQGYHVEPFYLRIWLEDELSHLGKCPWEEDLSYASAVCEQFGLKLEQLTLQKEYWEQVVEYTISEARAGRTPNPDVMCNSRIKFGVFLDSIGKQYEKIASGHYARIRKDPETGLFQLMVSADSWKDQTYFLAHLVQKQLSKVVFPIGHLTKEQVRAKARELNLATKARKDSQGICFLGQIKFDEFLRHHLGSRTGKLVESETGKVVGEHCGYWFYTPGQRKGLHLSNGPWYVVTKDIESNTVFVSRHYDSPEKQRNCFMVENVHWHIPLTLCSGELLPIQVSNKYAMIELYL
jgi:tRNA (5-methylaminomethyl-2-thiouridylate)-methyltransferase